MSNESKRVWLAAGLLALGTWLVPAGSAQAVVYCTGVGVPVGCVVRPAPVARAAAYCTRPGYPVGCVAHPAGAPGVGVTPGVGVGAPGVGVAPGASAVNRGGPVNRLGVR